MRSVWIYTESDISYGRLNSFFSPIGRKEMKKLNSLTELGQEEKS